MSAVEASRGRAIEAQRARATLTLVRLAGGTGLVGMALGAALAWQVSGIETRHLAEAWATQEVRDRLNPAMLFQTRPQADLAVEAETPEHAAAMTLLYRIPEPETLSH